MTLLKLTFLCALSFASALEDPSLEFVEGPGVLLCTVNSTTKVWAGKQLDLVLVRLARSSVYASTGDAVDPEEVAEFVNEHVSSLQNTPEDSGSQSGEMLSGLPLRAAVNATIALKTSRLPATIFVQSNMLEYALKPSFTQANQQ